MDGCSKAYVRYENERVNTRVYFVILVYSGAVREWSANDEFKRVDGNIEDLGWFFRDILSDFLRKFRLEGLCFLWNLFFKLSNFLNIKWHFFSISQNVVFSLDSKYFFPLFGIY